MQPTTISQEFALVAVVTLGIAVLINLYRVLFPARRRMARHKAAHRRVATALARIDQLADAAAHIPSTVVKMVRRAKPIRRPAGSAALH